MPKKNNSIKSSEKKKKNKPKANSSEVKKKRESEKSFKAQVLVLEQELQSIRDKNIRLLAEFENFKRRTRDEKVHLIRYSGEELILSLLPPIDDLRRTVDNLENTEEDSLKEAINLINSKLNKILKDKNIERFNTIGEDFNPELHEALMSEDGAEDNVILKEFECGYKYHDRIIRHAKVVVSKSDS